MLLKVFFNLLKICLKYWFLLVQTWRQAWIFLSSFFSLFIVFSMDIQFLLFLFWLESLYMRSWTFLIMGTWIRPIEAIVNSKSYSKSSRCSPVVDLRVGPDLFELARMNSLAIHYSGQVDSSSFESAWVNSLQNFTLV